MTGIQPEKSFKFKDGPHLIDEKIKEHDFQFPLQPSYDNPIVGFMHISSGLNGLDIIMSNGQKSNLAQISNNGGKNWEEARINPIGAVVKRVVIRYDSDTEVRGLQFFDKNNTLILQAGTMLNGTKEFNLEDGQRLIGIKSKLCSKGPRMFDLVFIIGWME